MFCDTDFPVPGNQVWLLVKTQFGDVSSAVSISLFFSCSYIESQLDNSLVNIGIIYLYIMSSLFC